MAHPIEDESGEQARNAAKWHGVPRPELVASLAELLARLWEPPTDDEREQHIWERDSRP